MCPTEPYHYLLRCLQLLRYVSKMQPKCAKVWVQFCLVVCGFKFRSVILTHHKNLTGLRLEKNEVVVSIEPILTTQIIKLIGSRHLKGGMASIFLCRDQDV